MWIYPMIVMVLHFAVHLLLMAAANRMLGQPSRWKMLLWAAAVGSLHAGACLLPGFSFLGSPLWRLVFLVLAALMAFGWSRAALHQSGSFLLLSLLLGLVALGMERGELWGLLLAAGLIWILCGMSGNAGGRRLVPVEIHHNGNSVQLTALVDTGNRLRDPITGEPVLIIDSRAARALTGLTPAQLEHPLESMGNQPGLRLIPYHSVGHRGFLLAIRPSRITVDGRKAHRVVAFAPGHIGRGEGYRALTGGAMG